MRLPRPTLANAGGIGKATNQPSPAPREREGPAPKAWEGEGLSVADTLTWPPLRVGHPLPRCGRGAFAGFAGRPVTSYAPTMIIGRLVGWMLMLAGLAVLLRDVLVRLDTERWVPLAVGDVRGWSEG